MQVYFEFCEDAPIGQFLETYVHTEELFLAEIFPITTAGVMVTARMED